MKKIAIIMGVFCTAQRPLSFNDLESSPRGLTGSDLILVRLSQHFAKLGWDTSIFTCQLPGHPETWQGCKIYDVHRKNEIIKSDWDSVISINDPRDFIGLPEGPVRLFSQQLNGLSYLTGAWEDLFDIATSPSEAHLEHHRMMYQQLNKWHVVHDACDYEPNLDLAQKVPGRIIWTSSADRGAHWLISIFAKIKKRVPHASLKVFYNFDYGVLEDHETLGPTVNADILELAQRIRYIKHTVPKLKHLGVEHVGSVSKNQIIEEYKKAEVFAFPCDTVQWTEGFSIGTLEALNYGCATIISDTDALGSLYEGYAEIIKGNPGKNLQQWEDTIVKALTDEQYRTGLIEKSRRFSPSHDFSVMAKKLESLIVNHPKFKNKDRTVIEAEFVEIKTVPVPTVSKQELVKLNIASGPNVFPSEGWLNFDREDIGSYLNYMNQVTNLNGMPEHQKNLANYLKNGGQILFKLKDIKEPFNEFTDNSVDLIYLGQCVEHFAPLKELPNFLKECHRMLKPGGVIRITTPDMDLLINAYLNGKMDKFAIEQPEFYKDADPSAQLAMMMYGSMDPNGSWNNYYGHQFLFTKTSMTKVLEQAGFSNIEFYYETGKSKNEVMAREAVDAGLSHSFVCEASKDDAMLVNKKMSFKNNYFLISCILDSVKVGGVQLRPGDHPTHHGFLDEADIRDELWNVNDGDIVLDVGAQFGPYTLTGLACGAERSYSWSPQSHESISEKSTLERSLKLNGWDKKSKVYGTGVFNKSGWLNINTQEFSKERPKAITGDIIEVSTLDDWYQNERVHLLNKRVWMKLDVEAAECEVLEGAQTLIKETQPIILIENHDCLVEGISLKTKNLMKSMFGYEEIKLIPYHSRSFSLYKKKI